MKLPDLLTGRGFAVRRTRALLRRFARNRSGVAAVEFALIAAPFFFLLFAMIEIAAVFVLGSILENAVLEAARDIRTGRAQSSGMSQAAFRTAVCDRIVVLGTCDNVEIDVRVFEDFDNVDQSSPIDGGAINTDDFGFDPGDAGDIVLVRVFYRWRRRRGAMVGRTRHVAVLGGCRCGHPERHPAAQPIHHHG
jgi:Flp pilus assembly protein TadG